MRREGYVCADDVNFRRQQPLLLPPSYVLRTRRA